MILAFLTGLVTGLGLIVAIGAQNAYVIREGLRRRHVFVVATVCFLCDAVLIAAGVGGVGTAIASTAWLRQAAAWGGGAFVLWFGTRSLIDALDRNHPGLAESAESIDARGTGAVRGAILAALAFSLLNPLVYIDTVLMLGTIGGQYPGSLRGAFLVGAVLASALWFYGIAYGASLAAPVLGRPQVARLLDGFVATVMYAVGTMLILSAVGAGA